MGCRVRFAPSPTGQLHIGGARTALSNYLFAKQNNGKFLLRIEDTDLERSKKQYVDQICDSLKWLGLKWDEKMVFQSSNTSSYRKAVDYLIRTEKAYYCFETKEESIIHRQKTGSFRYSGKWRSADKNLINESLEKKIPFTVRFYNKNKDYTIFNDLIYGQIRNKNSELDDFIIVRSDGTPVYNLTNVIDDNNMNISHVIRGEDHIANTSKQILLYDALKYQLPVFAHLPMILGPDKKRLSKRHGAMGVKSYSERGYQPESLINYLALLGWNPGTEEEIMNKDRLIKIFDLSKVQRKSAIFDLKKLNWMSGQYLKNQKNSEILLRIRKINELWGIEKNNKYCEKIIELNKVRSDSLLDLIANSEYFFNDPKIERENDFQKLINKDSIDLIRKYLIALEKIQHWNIESIENKSKDFMQDNQIGFGKLMKPIRFILCGALKGASIFHIIMCLGKEKTIFRLKKVSLINFDKESNE